jgi:hypothetical protein
MRPVNASLIKEITTHNASHSEAPIGGVNKSRTGIQETAFLDSRITLDRAPNFLLDSTSHKSPVFAIPHCKNVGTNAHAAKPSEGQVVRRPEAIPSEKRSLITVFGSESLSTGILRSSWTLNLGNW